MARSSRWLTAGLTTVTMLAFAANSLLCRMALIDDGGASAIDAGSFAAIRLASGAAVLFPLALAKRGKQRVRDHLSPVAAVALLGYAFAFSWAYVSLDTGVGALIMFATVQATMVGWGLWKGERPRIAEWLGLGMALAGLAYLTWPSEGAGAPVLGSGLMILAGIGWGVYSLRGRTSTAPVLATASSFMAAAPFAVLAAFVTLAGAHLSTRGVILAVVSGAVTSGLGYVLWYRALRGHTATSGAIVQLSVPVIAALAGIAVLDETVTLKLAVSGGLVLGGVALATARRSRPAEP